MFGKVRLAPKNALTIPRLELMAAVIGKRSALFVASLLDVKLTSITLWTDATTILQWYESSEILQPFIQNRINELRETKNITLRYVPTQDNPADCASRGKIPALLIGCELWWKGPAWLCHDRLWPVPPPNGNICSSKDEIHVHVLAIGVKVIEPLMTDGIEIKLASWNAHVRAMRNVIKASCLLGKLPFHISEMQAFCLGENLLIVELQLKYFQKEYNILRKGR